MKKLYLAVALAVVFVSWTSAAMQPQPDCTVTLKPKDSIQKAIDEVAPGAVICLEEGVWNDGFLIQKDITIRGAGPDNTIIRLSAIAWAELPISVVIQGLSVVYVLVRGPIRVTLQHAHILKDGLYIVGDATVDLFRVTILPSGFGLILFGQVTVTLTDSQVIGAGLGGIAVLGGGARLSLVNSRVLDNSIGISAGVGEQTMHITLERSVIVGNSWIGLVAGGLANIEIRESTIEDNGTDPQICGVTVCPGIEVGDQAKVVISNSRIAGNWDWGITAILRKCGYERDEFDGTIVFEGENTITGNNRSGRFVGEVCLP